MKRGRRKEILPVPDLKYMERAEYIAAHYPELLQESKHLMKKLLLLDDQEKQQAIHLHEEMAWFLEAVHSLPEKRRCVAEQIFIEQKPWSEVENPDGKMYAPGSVALHKKNAILQIAEYLEVQEIAYRLS